MISDNSPRVLLVELTAGFDDFMHIGAIDGDIGSYRTYVALMNEQIITYLGIYLLLCSH
jgi:hypothetical protein